MARPLKLSVTAIGEYYKTEHLLRPISRQLVENYKMLMETGTNFPSIVLGVYKGMKNTDEKLIIDGAHSYRALVLAKAKEHPVQILEFASLAEALAEQLKRNIQHGQRVTSAQRDARIRQLIEVHNWSVRDVAKAVGMHYASVSRINRGIQNKSKTGKPGAATEVKRAGNVVPHALPPKQFVRAVENIHLTLSKPDGKGLALMAIYDPKRPPQEVQRLVNLLREVANELSALTQTQPTARAAAG